MTAKLDMTQLWKNCKPLCPMLLPHSRQPINSVTMKKSLLIVIISTLTAALTACNLGARNPQTEEKYQRSDTAQTSQVHPVIENIFYNLPLEKSRLDLREVIVHDTRFILTDSTLNDYPPATFFKGNTADKGLIESNPDSIHVLLAYGNAALTTEKGGQPLRGGISPSRRHAFALDCARAPCLS